MSRRRRKDSEHLQDATDHLRVLKEHLRRGDLGDVLVRDAVSHRLEVAIDAVGRVAEGLLKAEIPDDWPKIVAMRNILAHQYAFMKRPPSANNSKPGSRFLAPSQYGGGVPKTYAGGWSAWCVAQCASRGPGAVSGGV